MSAFPAQLSAVLTGEAGEVVVRPHGRAHQALAAKLAGQHTTHNTQHASTPAPGVRPSALRTARLLLRPLALSDRPEFLSVLRLSRAHLNRFCPLDKADLTRNEPDELIFERQLALSDAAVATGRAWRNAAFDEHDRLVGAFNINDIARGLESSGEVVFWLGAHATGRGYAEEALRATLDHAFADLPRGLGLHRLNALIAPHNARCLKLTEKLGLKRLATPPTPLLLRGRQVPHETFAAFAPINSGVVEGKPSLADDLFGRGLLSILRTEATPPYPPANEAA